MCETFEKLNETEINYERNKMQPIIFKRDFKKKKVKRDPYC